MPRVTLELADVKQLPMTHRQSIPEDYLDAMGHMNVMWYTHVFGEGMGGVFQIIGLDWNSLQDPPRGSFALETHVRYLSEVRVQQAVEIHTRVIERSQKRFHLMHFMTNCDKRDVSATSEAVVGYIDMNSRRMAPLPDDVAARIDHLIAEHARLAWGAPTCGVMRA